MRPWVEWAEDRLFAFGTKPTSLRRKMLRVLAESNVAISRNDLWRSCGTTSQTDVDNALAVFKRCGIVHFVGMCRAYVRCQLQDECPGDVMLVIDRSSWAVIEEPIDGVVECELTDGILAKGIRIEVEAARSVVQ
jgi:Fe2+ or Zn2+ uptake regulation protein